MAEITGDEEEERREEDDDEERREESEENDEEERHEESEESDATSSIMLVRDKRKGVTSSMTPANPQKRAKRSANSYRNRKKQSK